MTWFGFCEWSTFSENTTRREGWWQVSECQYRHQDGWRWPAVLLSPVLCWDSKVCAWCKFISGWWHVLRSRFPENLIYFRVAADFTCPTCNSGELVKNAYFALETYLSTMTLSCNGVSLLRSSLWVGVFVVFKPQVGQASFLRIHWGAWTGCCPPCATSWGAFPPGRWWAFWSAGAGSWLPDM